MHLPDTDAPSPAPPARRGLRLPRLATLLRLAVTVVLLAIVLRQVSLEELGRAFTDVDPLWLSLSLAISPVLIFINALRWRTLLDAAGFRVGLLACFRLHLAGNFFNQVLPTGVGGDVMRAWYLGRRTGRGAEALASVFLERLTGLMVLIVLAAGSLVFCSGRLDHPAIQLLVAGAAAGSLLVLWSAIDPRLARLLHRVGGRWAARKLGKFQEAVDVYRSKRKALFTCLGISLLFHLTAALNVAFTVRTFRQDLPYSLAVLATPVILTVAMFPLSLGGLGVAEWAYLVVLGAFGVPPAPALSTALLLRVKGLFMGVVGGLDGGMGRMASTIPVGTAGPAETAAPAPVAVEEGRA